MNNIPVFFSQGGSATLILREIPYTARAYVQILSAAEDLPAMLAELSAFCRSCGAEQVFFSGADGLPECAELAYDLLGLSLRKPEDFAPAQDLTLIPVDAANAEDYAAIYNRCFRSVSHAAYYDRRLLSRLLRSQRRAFIAQDASGRTVGIGELADDELAAVAVLPECRGIGGELTLQLCGQIGGGTVHVTVASDNLPALSMYRRLGFVSDGALSSWYAAQ